MVDSLFKNLSLDRWYKLFVFLGIVGFVIALTIPVKTTVLSNNGLAIFSFGLFLFGIGEWKTWKPRIDTNSSISYLEKTSDGAGDIIQMIAVLLMLLSIVLSIAI